MRLLALLTLILLPVSAMADDASWLSAPSGNVTVLHQSSGIDYYYDQHRNSGTVYDVLPGLRWYSTQNSQGKITQGYVYEPFPRTEPLRVPSYTPLPSPSYPPLHPTR